MPRTVPTPGMHDGRVDRAGHRLLEPQLIATRQTLEMLLDAQLMLWELGVLERIVADLVDLRAAACVVTAGL
jgi:hypothetical protein